VVRPLEASLRPNGTVPELNFRTMRIRPEMNRVEFDRVRNMLRIGKKQARKIEKLLTAYTQCPLVFIWRDLGTRFWPRWFRDAQCYQNKAKLVLAYVLFPLLCTCVHTTAIQVDT
jgi:noggin